MHHKNRLTDKTAAMVTTVLVNVSILEATLMEVLKKREVTM